MTFKTLEDRVVLAVHRQEFDVMLLRCGHHEFTGEHQHLFRGEGNVLTRGNRREGRLEARGAYDGHQNQVCLRQGGELDQTADPAVQAGASREAGGGHGLIKRPLINHRDMGNVKRAGDFCESAMIQAGGDADEFKFVGMGGNHPQRILADRARGAQKDNAFARS